MSENIPVRFTMGSSVTDSNPPKLPGLISLDKSNGSMYIDTEDGTRLQVKDTTKMPKFGEYVDMTYAGNPVHVVSVDDSKIFALGQLDTQNLSNSNGYILSSTDQTLNFNDSILITMNEDHIVLKHNACTLNVTANGISIQTSPGNILTFGSTGQTNEFTVRVEGETAGTSRLLKYQSNGKLSGISNPDNYYDAANKQYVDTCIHNAISWEDF